jgi:hypothetical protein
MLTCARARVCHLQSGSDLLLFLKRAFAPCRTAVHSTLLLRLRLDLNLQYRVSSFPCHHHRQCLSIAMFPGARLPYWQRCIHQVKLESLKFLYHELIHHHHHQLALAQRRIVVWQSNYSHLGYYSHTIKCVTHESKHMLLFAHSHNVPSHSSMCYPQAWPITIHQSIQRVHQVALAQLCVVSIVGTTINQSVTASHVVDCTRFCVSPYISTLDAPENLS